MNNSLWHGNSNSKLLEKKKTFQHIREQYILFCYQESMSEKLQFINYWTEMRSQGHELNNWIQSCNANSPVRG